MPTPLHKEIAWLQTEIDLCDKVIAEMKAKYPPSADRAAAIARIEATRRVHEASLAELQRQLAPKA